VALYAVLATVGLCGGFFAGWVGLGGGIILAPLLLYLPLIVGMPPFDIKEVARLTMLQSLCSTAAAGLAHRRARQVSGPLVRWMGAIIAVASLSGALLSEVRLVSSELLLGLLATMAIAASVLMLRRPPDTADDVSGVASGAISFHRGRAAVAAMGVGLTGGMVGQSGAFLTIPILIHGLRMPTRLAIGSSLGITFCAALAGSLGKFLGGGPIVWPHAAILVAGSLVGSQLGSALSQRTSATSVRYVLAVLIGASAARMWCQVLS
jgi:uncharacterized membrane protein YfcA